MAMEENELLPEWLRGRRLRTDPYKIPGDRFIERTFVREETGQVITVRRSTEKDVKTGDPFVSFDTTTRQPVGLTPEERHQSFLDFSIQPTPELVRELRSKKMNSHG